MATPATAAAASVPISAAWTKGIDFRNTRRIACSRLASCYKRFGERSRFLARKCGNNESPRMNQTPNDRFKFRSSPRKRGPSFFRRAHDWIPGFAGMSGV